MRTVFLVFLFFFLQNVNAERSFSETIDFLTKNVNRFGGVDDRYNSNGTRLLESYRFGYSDDTLTIQGEYVLTTSSGSKSYGKYIREVFLYDLQTNVELVRSTSVNYGCNIVVLKSIGNSNLIKEVSLNTGEIAFKSKLNLFVCDSRKAGKISRAFSHAIKIARENDDWVF